MNLPEISFGTYRLGETVYDALNLALLNGYRGIDTAALYKCEHIIGDYLTRNEINRDELFITSKLLPNIMIKSESEILESISKTLADLNTKYLDLYLIHCPKDTNINIKCWEIIEKFHRNGIFKNIGVSNFDIHHMEDIHKHSLTPIYTNQIELSPFLKRPNVVKYMNDNNIIVSAHSSLAKGEMFQCSILQELGHKYNKTPAQIMLKWGLQNNYRIMPRSNKKDHINDNIDLNFIISDEDINELNNIPIIHTTHPKYILS
jgi:diketogulonate reductase-like aldo/keto reductase